MQKPKFTPEQIVESKGADPAFPVKAEDGTQHFGLTKRQHIATEALKAMLSNPKLYTPDNQFPVGNFKMAWYVADRFLAEEGPVKL